MPRIFAEKVWRARTAVKFGMGMRFGEPGLLFQDAHGRFIFDMRDAATGKQLAYFEEDNVITKDAGILGARLYRDSTEPAVSAHNGLKMLAVGTGATGAILSPDAPTNTQRSLNNEIERKTFSSAQFRDANGFAVTYPTNIVDFTTTYGESEAVGPLNEMGLMFTVSDNPTIKNPLPAGPGGYDPTIDVTTYDIMVNYLTFSVISKPATAIVSLTWRLTF